MESSPPLAVPCVPPGERCRLKSLFPFPSRAHLCLRTGPVITLRTDSGRLPGPLVHQLRLVRKVKGQVIFFCDNSRVSHFYFNGMKITFVSSCNQSATLDSNSSITFSIHSPGMGYKRAGQHRINHGQQQRHFL